MLCARPSRRQRGGLFVPQVRRRPLPPRGSAGQGRQGQGQGQGRREAGGRQAPPPRGRLHRLGQGGRARDPQPSGGRLGVRREADRGGGGRGRGEDQDRVPRLEPVPLQARRRHPRRGRLHLDEARLEGALPRRRVGHVGLARLGPRRRDGLRLRRRVLPPLGPRPDQRREEAHKHHPDHRGRAPPAKVPDARRHGRLHLRRRRAARPGAHRRAQRRALPQERRPLGHLDQGQLHRLHRPRRACLRQGGAKAAGRPVQAARAAHPRAVRARPRRRRLLLPARQVQEAKDELRQRAATLPRPETGWRLA
mmetsp:Transcript_6718/g.21458  ORF Transcript_6718/g.21458 Transcript_6718/m.21458 type:complete len:308 (+) Transcript_6718:670-1593(+)